MGCSFSNSSDKSKINKNYPQKPTKPENQINGGNIIEGKPIRDSTQKTGNKNNQNRNKNVNPIPENIFDRLNYYKTLFRDEMLLEYCKNVSNSDLASIQFLATYLNNFSHEEIYSQYSLLLGSKQHFL
jgi:hypothetical protein